MNEKSPNKNKNAFIVVWFGALPYWFEFFLRSCEHNPLYDWLIWSDATPPKNLPSNVKMIDFSLQEFNKLASYKLNRTVEVARPYKLCDYKPMYGLVWEEALGQYDYWGFCDLDVIWGDIDQFFRKYLIQRTDIITCGGATTIGGLHYRIQGPCTLVRNSERLNKSFINTPDYRRAIAVDGYVCFDEGSWDQYIKGRSDISLEILLNLSNFENGDAVLESTWINGKLYLPSGREIVVHHMIEKNRKFEKVNNAFCISPKK